MVTVRPVRKAFLQQRDEAIVKFDGHDPARLLGDEFGQHAGTGADFEHGVVCGEVRGGDDARPVGRVDEEVLPQPLLRADAERASRASSEGSAIRRVVEHRERHRLRGDASSAG